MREAVVSDETYHRDNVGWNAWNMSKEVSRIEWMARQARERVESLHVQSLIPSDALSTVEALLAALEVDARDALDTWEKICRVVSEDDPTLITPPVDGVSIVKNHGSNPALMERVWAVWGESSFASNGRSHFEELEALLPGSSSG